MTSPDAPLVIGLGELLWDVFPDSQRPGGAPSNVAFQASQLGLNGLVASRVGEDPLGDELLEFLDSKGLDTSLIQRDAEYETGRVTVDISDSGHPDYVIHENTAWDHLEPTSELLDAAGRAAAVCFGTLAQRSPQSRETIHQVLNTCSDECLIVYDVNLRQHWYDREWIERSLELSTIAKLNLDEAAVLCRLLDLDIKSIHRFASGIREQFEIELVCITRAERGCWLSDINETVDLSGEPVDVVDAVGAGDAFSAALIATRLWGWPLQQSAEFANAIGGLVASHSGAMPDLADQFAELKASYTV
ncbi:MAG: carbohydrate kinase [Planctomycetaceae bacterium]|nr:carbohydrate kinase [Planctomycetaceae bacterium]